MNTTRHDFFKFTSDFLKELRENVLLGNLICDIVWVSNLFLANIYKLFMLLHQLSLINVSRCYLNGNTLKTHYITVITQILILQGRAILDPMINLPVGNNYTCYNTILL